MKRLLLLAVLAAVALPGSASASGSPCGNKVINDWYRDGKIASTYSQSCYRDALKHIPTDADIYSNLRDDVNAAMRAELRRAHGATVPSQVGHGPTAVGAGNVKGTLASISATAKGPHDPASGGSIADTASNAPLPILVLGGIALALAAAGAIGVGVRRVRGRR